MRLTIGCDPEFFLLDTQLGTYVSAHNILPGTKEEPFKVDGGAVQVDGVAVEFNTDPACTAQEFAHNIRTVLGELRKMIPAKYVFDFRPAVVFEPSYFKKLPRTAVELGCTPDWNGYTFQHNPRPDGANTTMRTASGHVHIGWDRPTTEITENHIKECGRIARNLDVTLGMASLEWDRDTKRRQLYGKAGCYRPKPYGIEYRTLSNAWLKDDRLIYRVFNGAIHGVSDYFENGVNCAFMKQRQDVVQEAINRGRRPE